MSSIELGKAVGGAGCGEGLGKIGSSVLDMFSMRCVLHMHVEMTSRRLDSCIWSPAEKSRMERETWGALTYRWYETI